MNSQLKKQVASPDQLEMLWSDLSPQLDKVVTGLSKLQSQAFFRVLGDANFLARWARLHPDEVKNLLLDSWEQAIDGPTLEKHWEKRILRHSDTNFDEWLNHLLRFKYYQLFRITLKDVGKLVPFNQTAHELSSLARFIIQKSLSRVMVEWQKKWGVPRTNAPASTEIPFTVLALGKLGGMELNYSSDVDIVYLYGTDQGKVIHPDLLSEKTPHQFFCKIGEQLGHVLSKKNSEGFLYRVDLELRPEGKSGALANSLSAMETYYESFGAYWEKQALIKCSCTAGDEKLFAAFHKMIQPFIFPKSSDFSLIEKVRDMKSKVEASLQSSSQQEYHVKLGRGGIREIEFFVQTLQILYGGRIPSLKTTNTLAALRTIKEQSLLKENDEKELRDAYIYLRTMEHRLQLVEEQQTHRLPKNPDALVGLARRMGYFQESGSSATEQMLIDLEKHRRNVELNFNKLLNRPST